MARPTTAQTKPGESSADHRHKRPQIMPLDSKLKLKSTPAPLGMVSLLSMLAIHDRADRRDTELDSDSDFNAGPVKPEPHKPKKKGSGRKPKVDVELSDADDDFVARPMSRWKGRNGVLNGVGAKKSKAGRSTATNTRRMMGINICHNPLLEYFGMVYVSLSRIILVSHCS